MPRQRLVLRLPPWSEATNEHESLPFYFLFPSAHWHTVSFPLRGSRCVSLCVSPSLTHRVSFIRCASGQPISRGVPSSNLIKQLDPYKLCQHAPTSMTTAHKRQCGQRSGLCRIYGLVRSASNNDISVRGGDKKVILYLHVKDMKWMWKTEDWNESRNGNEILFADFQNTQ